uniref:Glycosyl transferase family 1 domain-containing protein n=1 Tax=Aureoumbra lagunensis TaxID=44058 RepID=A0A7S3JSR9_9STRA
MAVSLEDSSNEKIKVSETVLTTRPGWSTLEARLLLNDTLLSSHAVAVYAPISMNESLKISQQKLGIAWDLGGGIGWGVLGLHASLALVQYGILPVPLRKVHGYDMSQIQRSALGPSLLFAALHERKETPDFPVVHALGRWGKDGALGSMRNELWSRNRNLGILFAETRTWSESDLKVLAKFNGLLLGSSWCAQALRLAAEHINITLPPTSLFLQGVDTGLFFPPSAVTRDQNARFRIFSGGKLEWRKGHDIVVESFKRFIAKHPEANAELFLAWTNPWPLTVASMTNATHTQGIPESVQITGVNSSGIRDWLEKNGLDREHFISLPALPHNRIPELLRSVDAALFPNRVEGGTNLVAMESVAAGIPTILSATTGHIDLLNSLGWDHGAWALRNQSFPRPPGAPFTEVVNAPSATQLGGESDPDEAVDALGQIYLHRATARRRALKGAKVMQAWTWVGAVRILVREAFPLREIIVSTLS